jgi:hypothetical protein
MIRKAVEFVREGNYAVEVPIDLIVEDGGWSPYFSLDDARKLEAVRLALRQHDLVSAARHGRVFELVPVAT